MSRVFLDRKDGRLALYLHGDLQFDAADERLYHEPLAGVPLLTAARRFPGRALRAAILGGGDGLALREALKVPGVARVDVVDKDPEVLRLGRGELAALNEDALRDPRTVVREVDARDFIKTARDLDAVIMDLTYPKDLEGASLFSSAFLRRIRAALRPGGVLAVNAVSPERTPRAFGCVGATLAAAGFDAVPYAFELPSFRAEGYGRWGFLFASTRPIGEEELPEALRPGCRLPTGARRAMEAGPNRTDELLYYVANSEPLAWSAPYEALRFERHPGGLALSAPAGRLPRLRASEGFARWLEAPEGQRTLEGLLACLPLSDRSQTRELILEWRQQAEVLFEELDIARFAEESLRRARGLPESWLAELRALRERLREGRPSMEELLGQAYRVFAVFLIMMLLVNLAFPDNLFAKGFSSHYSGGGSYSAPSRSFQFSDYSTGYRPYRYRRFRTYDGFYGRRPPGDRVYDPQGRAFSSQRFLFTDPKGGTKPLEGLLALNDSLRLLESGVLAYVPNPPVPGFHFLLEPGRLRVLTESGREALVLSPMQDIQSRAATLVHSQKELIDKALAEHRKWLDWVGWAGALPGGGEAKDDMRRLEAVRRAVDAAMPAWANLSPIAEPPQVHNWRLLFPGVYLQPRCHEYYVDQATCAPLNAELRLGLVSPDLSVRALSLEPPASLSDADRFLYHVLSNNQKTWYEISSSKSLSRWVELHGAALSGGSPP